MFDRQSAEERTQIHFNDLLVFFEQGNSNEMCWRVVRRNIIPKDKIVKLIKKIDIVQAAIKMFTLL